MTASPPRSQPSSAQYIIEGIILRRLHEKRIEGYTLEMSKEIAAAISAVAQQPTDSDETAHVDWDILAEERLGQRPVEHGRHIPQTSPAPGCDSGSHPAQVSPDRDAIARIIDPDAMQKYEADFGDKAIAPTWNQIIAYPSVKIAREKADAVIALMPQPSGLAYAAKEPDALGYATRLLEHFVKEHFPHNPDWKPLPDLIGVLTQLDNATTIARDYKERLRAYEGSPVPSTNCGGGK